MTIKRFLIGILLIVQTVIGFQAGSYWQSYQDKNFLQDKTVDLGCGRYNERTGRFEFVQIISAIDPMQLAPIPVPEIKPKKKGH